MKKSICLTMLLCATTAFATTRETALVHARSYAQYPWHSSANNQSASCSAAYESLFPTGDYVGLPYDWGGYMTLAEFSTQIASGYGAGSQASDGVLACTSGLDCSGFVSQCWEVGHFATATLNQTSAAIAVDDMLPADVFNMAGYHVAMLARFLDSGQPLLYEAIGYNVRVNPTGGFSHVDGYTPRKQNAITGSGDTDPVGTMTKPIVIGALPYTDSRDTKTASSKAIDACSVAPSVDQKGPEFVYSVTITSPGTLTISVTDDATTDVDVQLYNQLNYPGCIARNDKTITQTVGCGTYYIVADTFKTSAGAYTLSVTHTPSGQSCGAVAGPPAFNPGGALGTPCGNPNNPSLPFCNANLGGDVCIYSASTSMCSKPCSTVGDCAGIAGACCEALSDGETYCMAGSFCSGGGTTTPMDGGTIGDPSSGDLAGANPDPGPDGDVPDPNDPVDMKKAPPTSKDLKGVDLTGGEPDPEPTSDDMAAGPGVKTAGDVGCNATGVDPSFGLSILLLAFALRRKQ